MILHKECLATELAVTANRTAIASVFLTGAGAAHAAGATIYTKAEADTAIALRAPAFSVQEEGAVVQAAPTAINFVGAGFTASTVGTVATVTLSGTKNVTGFAWDAAGDGSATITFSDASTLAVAAMPAPAVC